MALISRIATALVAATLVVATLSLVPVAVSDTTVPTVREMRVPAPGLTREVTILHVTDLHGATFGPGQKRVVALLAGRHVDAVVFTGDLIARRWSDRTAVRTLVGALRPFAGEMLYVPGNHDDDALGGELGSLGVRTVVSGRTYPLTPVVGEGTGVEFVSAGAEGRIAAWPDRDGKVLVVAMHQPPATVLLARASRLTSGTQVFLAGHTHGGQVRMPGVGALIAPTSWGSEDLPSLANQILPELRGLMIDGAYRRGRQYVDVSAGLGTSKVPFRLFAPAEVTLVRLVPAP